MKLIKYLQSQSNLSGREIKRQLERGACLVNGKIETFASRQISKRDRIEFNPVKFVQKEMEIIFENDEMYIFNKPSGMVCEGENLVHRLDKGTSGCWVHAKTEAAYHKLTDAFRKREVEKVYHALVSGRPEKDSGVISAPIAKIQEGLWGIHPEGKEAITRWKILEERGETTVVECRPVTGRTHQIRIHMAHLGCPVVGDLTYGREGVSAPRLMLHAYSIFEVICDRGDDFF